MQQNLRTAAITTLVLLALLGVWYLTQHTPHDQRESTVGEPANSMPQKTPDDDTHEAAGPDRGNTQEKSKAVDGVISDHTVYTVRPSMHEVNNSQPMEWGRIEGVVRANGQPAVGYVVLCDYGPGDSSAPVDANGKYAFENVPVGRVNLMLRKPNKNTGGAYEQVEVTASATTRHDFDLVAGTSTLTGTVTLEGKPLPSTQVSLVVEVEGSRATAELSRTDNDGIYRFETLPAGNALVKLIRKTGRFEEPIYEAALTEGATSTLDIEIAAAASLSGKVSGVPQNWQLMGALVRGDVPMPQPDLQTLMTVIQDRMVIGGTMSDDGFYELEGIPPGKYTAIVYATPRNPEEKGFVQAGGEVTVEDGAQSVSLDLTLE